MNGFTPSRVGVWAAHALLMVMAGCGAGTVATDVAERGEYAAVYLVDTEQLEPPAVGQATVFKPMTGFDIDPEDESVGRATGFFLTVATDRPESLKMRLVDLSHSGQVDAKSGVKQPLPYPLHRSTRSVDGVKDGSDSARLFASLPLASLPRCLSLPLRYGHGSDGGRPITRGHPESDGTISFTAVAPPTVSAEVALAAEPRPFNDAVRDHLQAGRGVFWPTPGPTEGKTLEQRVGVLVPEYLLGSFTRLELYTREADDGTPLGSARIGLVRDFFYLAVIGDSIQWGNGLREDDKMSSLVTEVIERETRRKVILQRYAQSGASIIPGETDGICEINCRGEVPTARTSIITQAGLIQRPDLVDLVLIDGCINDVGLGAIIDPLFPQEEMIDRTQQFCGDEMGGFLRTLQATVPRARIVVTGYYQIVGPESDLFALQAWLTTRGVESTSGEPTDNDSTEAEPSDDNGAIDDGPADESPNEDGSGPDEDPTTEAAALVELLAGQSAVFDETARTALIAAVDSANAEIEGDAKIAFADPGFSPENAIFGPDAWLWSMTAHSALFEGIDVGLELFPEDPLARLRVSACFDHDVVVDPLWCLYGSVGHPNPRGARAYAEALIDQLRGLGVLPAADGGE